MNKTQYIAYSVGKNFDYQFVAISDFLPEGVWSRFREQIVGALRTENIVNSLKSPRWLFSRYRGYALWGMATYNGYLASDSKYATDIVGRSEQQLRVFLGMVCDGTISSLPVDDNFFKDSYKEIIEPKWDAPLNDASYFQKGVVVSTSLANYHTIHANAMLQLNANEEKVRFCSSKSNIFEYLSAALATSGDISCMGTIKNGHKEFASLKQYHYNNVIVEGQTMDEDVPLKEEKPKREREKEAKYSSKPIEYSFDGFEDTDINNGNDDRKMYGGSKKAIASVALAILLLVLLVILLLKKK